MTYSGKIVLDSTSGYRPDRDDEFLRDLLKDRIELFSVLGIDADEWEDALDWICVGDDGLGDYVVITTSHKNEDLAQVIEFAESFETSREHAVQVIRR